MVVLTALYRLGSRCFRDKRVNLRSDTMAGATRVLDRRVGGFCFLIGCNAGVAALASQLAAHPARTVCARTAVRGHFQSHPGHASRRGPGVCRGTGMRDRKSVV